MVIVISYGVFQHAVAGSKAGVATTAEGGGGESWCRRASTEALDGFVDRRALRRMDAISRLAILGSCLALRDAGIERPDERMGIALSTGYGPSGTTLAFLDAHLKNADVGAAYLASDELSWATFEHVTLEARIGDD